MAIPTGSRPAAGWISRRSRVSPSQLQRRIRRQHRTAVCPVFDAPVTSLQACDQYSFEVDREAARSLMTDDPFSGRSAYEWASFSLTGDWR